VMVDKDDLELLKLMSTNARMPLIEMGEKLKMHPKTVASRIKRLERENIIIGYRFKVDFSKMGYRFYKTFFTLKHMDKDNYKKLMGYLHLHPNIMWTTKLLGKFDLSVEICVETVAEFRRFLDEFKNKFSNFIKQHESLLIFEEDVMDYLPLE